MTLLLPLKQRFHLSWLTLALAALSASAATLTVTNTADSGVGSLRDAIATANSGDVINFSLPNPSTITLTSGPLDISKNLVIMGPGATQLAVDANHQSSVFVTAGTVTLSGLTIKNGTAINGGGILNLRTLTVTNSTLLANSASSGGGGIYNEPEGTVTVINSTLSGNSAMFGGGIRNSGIPNNIGISNTPLGVFTLAQSTLSGNSASSGGGGIENEGVFTLTNSTLSGNSANSGGGIRNNSTTYTPPALTLVNSTVSGNSTSGGGGGGIQNFNGAITVKSTLLANNGSDGNCLLLDITNSLGYNLSDDSTCTLSGPGDENNVTSGAGLDPKGLQNNGGLTQTIAPLPSSPAVDHIPVADCTDANGNPVSTDQLGIARPQGKGCDVGAYELVPAAPFASFRPALAIDDGKHPGFVLTSTFTLGSATTGLYPATEPMTLQIDNYMLTLPAGSFHQLWKAANAPYGYEGTVHGATVVLGLIPLGNNTFSFDAAGSPVTFPGITNPVTVTLSFGTTDTGTDSVKALIRNF